MKKKQNKSRTILSLMKNILVLIAFSLGITVGGYAQSAALLQITLKITKAPFTKKQIPATVVIKNVGSSPVVIPAIVADYPNDYISFEITHQLSNIRVDFLDRMFFSEAGRRLPDTTEVLQPNAEKSYNLKINGSGSGLFGLPDPQHPESIQKYDGFFNIRAKFVVDNNNLPLGGDITNLFRGIVLSTSIKVFVKS